jgi:hypothetical protein
MELRSVEYEILRDWESVDKRQWKAGLCSKITQAASNFCAITWWERVKWVHAQLMWRRASYSTMRMNELENENLILINFNFGVFTKKN